MSKKSVLDITKMFESNQNFRPIRKAEIKEPSPPPLPSQGPPSEEPTLVASFRVNPEQQQQQVSGGLNEEKSENPRLNIIKRPRQPNKVKPSSTTRLLHITSDFEQQMESFESKENEQVNLLTDKTNEMDDYEKRKQHAMQLEQILKPELLIDRRLFPEKKEAQSMSVSSNEVVIDSDGGNKRESVDHLKQEIRLLRNELDETRSELARVQINFNSFEIESRQAQHKQNIEMEKLRKKLVFIMRKGFLAQMDSSTSSTFIGNNANGHDATRATGVEAASGTGHVSRPRFRKNAANNNGNHQNNNNIEDSSADENGDLDDAESKINKRKSSEFEEDGVIKF